MPRFDSNRRFCAFSFIPSMILICMVILIPVIIGISLSFTNLFFLKPTYQWIGFDNFSRLLFSDRHTWGSVFATFKWVIGTTGAMYLLGLMAALLLNNNFPGNTIARVIVILPWVVPNVVASYMWEWLYDPTYGGVNWILSKFLQQEVTIHWTGRSDTALFALMGVMIWRGVPFMTIMLLAALKTIPVELYEAATVDGAGPIKRLWYITIPSIRNVSGVSLLLMSIWMSNHFDIPFTLTGGGPGDSSMLLSIRTYLLAMLELRLGYASANGVLLMILMMIAAIFYLKTILKEERT
jgi:multiple sugar transport system permease protein